MAVCGELGCGPRLQTVASVAGPVSLGPVLKWHARGGHWVGGLPWKGRQC